MDDFNNLLDADDTYYDEFTGEKVNNELTTTHYSISVSSDSDAEVEVDCVDHGCSSNYYDFESQSSKSSYENDDDLHVDDCDNYDDLLTSYIDDDNLPVDIKQICFHSCNLKRLSVGDGFFNFAKNSQNNSTATKISSNSENGMRLYSSNVRKYLNANPKKPQKISEIWSSWTKERFSDYFKHRMETMKSSFTMNANVKPAMNKFFEYIQYVATQPCPIDGCGCRIQNKEIQKSTPFCKYCGCGCQPREEDLNTAKYICCHNSNDECFSESRPNLMQCNDCNKIFGACMFNQHLFDVMTAKSSYATRIKKYMQCNLCYKNQKPKRVLSKRKGTKRAETEKIRCGDTVRLRYDSSWRKVLLGDFETKVVLQYYELLDKGMEYSCVKLKFPRNMNGEFTYTIWDETFKFDSFVRRNGQYMIGDVIKVQDDSKVYFIAGGNENTVAVYEIGKTDYEHDPSYNFSRQNIEGLFCTKEELTFAAKKKAVFNLQAYEAKNLKQVVSLVQSDLQTWNLQKFVALNSFTKADYTMAFDKLKNYKRSLVLKKRELQNQYKKWKCDLVEKLNLLSAKDDTQTLAYLKKYVSLKHKCDVDQILVKSNKKKVVIRVLKHAESRQKRKIFEFEKRRKKGVLNHSLRNWFVRTKNISMCRQVIDGVLGKIPILSMCRELLFDLVDNSIDVIFDDDSEISEEDFLN